MMDLNKLEEMLIAAKIALPVVNEDQDGRIEGADGIFKIYDEGGASEAQAAYVVALLNAAPELIALIRKREARIDELTVVTGDQHMRLDAVLLLQAGLVNALNYAILHLRGEERDIDGVEHKARIALAAVGVTS